ncbi:phosphate/phosphite/phosphonate ABC transporter substrate-binding protein [uncultured Desulfuromonas sp.]|uniref:phosphate/phosphite/phosphonate ABC transporter substrate-binding protein n=1 Tax=uncultured Desulfuromonas sp. TaxID=181013 RepID=UPI002AAAE5AC|nr:phosphate/phosphite/phosphonate ABC transporter substrate-binding protein [uncultured Desulfuromonas sp.]
MTKRGFFSMCLLMVGLVWPYGLLQAETTDHTALHFAMIPKKNIDQQIDEMCPLLRLLADKLERPVNVVRVSSYQAVIEGLLSADIDLAIMGPASYAYAKQRDGRIEAFASLTRKAGIFTPEGSYYQSVLVTLAENGAKTISELRGTKVAFTDPKSTSGSVIPRHEFSRKINTSLQNYFGGMSYTGSHDRSIRALVNYQIDAAFVSSSRLDEAVRKGIVTPQQVRILWRSQPIHFDPFVFRGHLPQSLKEQIRHIMFSSPEALRPMFDKKNATGIVAVSDNDYTNIRAITRQEH